MFIQRVINFIKWVIPYGIVHIYQNNHLDNYYEKENEIKNYFLSLNSNTEESEIKEIIEYFQKYRFSIFPYEFFRKYYALDFDVLYDEKTKTRYVIHENKRLYFPKGWNAENVRNYYNGICMEQDKESPHRYETEKFSVQDGNVIADIGVAEGIWALNYVDKAEYIYLFECDKQWIDALKKTFEPWKEKVIIVNKYVSNINDRKNISLDRFFYKKKIDFIKVDIEGMETKLLEGSKHLLSENNMKILICTYHLHNDAIEIKEMLEKNNYTIEYSKKYMLFILDKGLKKPYIRRGLIRAIKDK
jgi:hypothetical protein